MQLTSTPGAPESLRQRTPSLLSRLNHPAVPGAVAFLGWLGYVLARWQVWGAGHLSRFIALGTKYTVSHHLPPSVMISDHGAAGYDGQFYYRLALNPFNWSKTAYGITMDQSYRYTRIGYPLVSWLGSFGQHDLVPASLIAVNLVCVAAMAVVGGMFARESGRHALWGLLFAAYFGLAISVGRDTAEPLAEACMLAGLLAYRRGRWGWSALAFAFGAITRETILFAPAAIALVRLYGILRGRVRPGRPDLAWLSPAVAYGIVELAAHFALKGEFPVLTDNSRNLAAPFTAMVDGLRVAAHNIDTSHLGLYDIVLLEYVALGLFILAGFLVIAVTEAPVHERIAFVFFVLELGLLSSQIWSSTFGDGRSLIEPYLLALILLFATPKRYMNTYRLAAIAAIALPVLAVVTRRRILYI
ncbi:MAG TPA: hypothetical protein VF070_49435 [Streptosporangiaceae bacterium]